MKTNACKFAILIFLTLLPFSLSAQKSHDLSIHYGILTSPELFDASPDLFSSMDQPGYSREYAYSWGGLGFTYRKFFNRIQSVTFVGSYNFSHGEVLYDNAIVGESDRDFFTVAAEWNIHYLRFDYFQMYSGGGLGVTMIFEDNTFYEAGYQASNDSKIYPNFDFTFVGFRFGGAIGGFTELGFGYKGLLRLGVSYQF